MMLPPLLIWSVNFSPYPVLLEFKQNSLSYIFHFPMKARFVEFRTCGCHVNRFSHQSSSRPLGCSFNTLLFLADYISYQINHILSHSSHLNKVPYEDSAAAQQGIWLSHGLSDCHWHCATCCIVNMVTAQYKISSTDLKRGFANYSLLEILCTAHF